MKRKGGVEGERERERERERDRERKRLHGRLTLAFLSVRSRRRRPRRRRRRSGATRRLAGVTLGCFPTSLTASARRSFHTAEAHDVAELGGTPPKGTPKKTKSGTSGHPHN